MRHTSFISIAILAFVGASAGLDEPYLDEYDPFPILSPECDSGKTTTSCFSSNTNKKNPAASYKQKQLWRHYFYGDMTVSVAEYFSETELEKEQKKRSWKLSDYEKRMAGCKRVIAFSVRGVLLDGVVVTNDCQDTNLISQIIYIDNALWHYPNMRIKLDSSGKQVIVVKLKNVQAGMQIKKMCEKMFFTLQGQSKTVKPDPKTESVDLYTSTDEYCKALLGETGPFPGSSVPRYSPPEVTFTINIQNKPYLGIKFWRIGVPFCHWKVVVFLIGHPLAGTGIFCGGSRFRDIVVTKNGLYFGKNIMARSPPTDPTEATVLLNTRSGYCIKRQYKLDTVVEQGKRRSYVNIQSITTMHEPDQECKDFVEGKLTEQQMKIDRIASAMKELEGGQVEVIPHFVEFMKDGWRVGPHLASKDMYVPQFNTVHVSNGNDMDALVIVNKRQSRWLVLVAKGVIIDVASIGGMPSFDVTPDTIVCNSLLMIERDQKDGNLFSVLSNWDGNVCTRTRYVLVNKGGRLYRQEVFPAEIAVTDKKCMLLLGQEPIVNFTYAPSISQDDDATTLIKEDRVDPDLVEYLS